MFSGQTGSGLFSFQLLLRLYGKNRREVCVGEMAVKLAEVLDRIAGHVIWGKFERKLI